MYSTVAKQSYILQIVHLNISIIQPAPYIVITILLTLFPML